MNVLVQDKFQEIEHTADKALEIWGETIDEFFINALAGYYHLLNVKEYPDCPLEQKIRFAENSIESLLVIFINEFIFLADQGMIFPIIDLEIKANSLLCIAKGFKSNEITNHIKALTYHKLKIEKYDLGDLRSNLVFDV